MKIRYVIILLVGLFVLSLVIDRNASAFSTDRVRWMGALEWTGIAMGIVITAISAFRLLHFGLQGGKLPQIMPTAVALFGGLTLCLKYWPVPISFAALLIAWLIVEHLKPADQKPEE